MNPLDLRHDRENPFEVTRLAIDRVHAIQLPAVFPHQLVDPALLPDQNLGELLIVLELFDFRRPDFLSENDAWGAKCQDGQCEENNLHGSHSTAQRGPRQASNRM